MKAEPVLLSLREICGNRPSTVRRRLLGIRQLLCFLDCVLCLSQHVVEEVGGTQKTASAGTGAWRGRAALSLLTPSPAFC